MAYRLINQLGMSQNKRIDFQAMFFSLGHGAFRREALG